MVSTVSTVNLSPRVSVAILRFRTLRDRVNLILHRVEAHQIRNFTIPNGLDEGIWNRDRKLIQISRAIYHPSIHTTAGNRTRKATYLLADDVFLLLLDEEGIELVELGLKETHELLLLSGGGRRVVAGRHLIGHLGPLGRPLGAGY